MRPGPGRIAREYAIVPTEMLSSTTAAAPVHGLRGEYFDNNRLDGRPRLVRTDARVDFGWTLNSPGARHSVRLVLGAVDRPDHDRHRAA